MQQLLHSKILGEGKPLLILHGFLGMLDNWKTLGSQYAEHGFQVHLIDQRNHGKSFHSNQFSYELMATDLHYYCMHHNIKSCALLGHSMGGKTAMLFAVSYPDLVQKLIVADIAPKYYPPHHQQILAGLQAIDFTTLSSRKEADDILANYVSDFGTRQFLLKNLYRKDKDTFDFRFNLPALVSNVENIGKALPSESIFEGETLFVRGDKSDYITENDFNLITKHFPKAEIKTISNAGHWLHAENPEEFFKTTLNFLS